MASQQDTILPDDDDLARGLPGDLDDDDETDADDESDDEHQVARQTKPEAIREDEEEELAEADLLEKDVDDLKQMEGPDA
jgi:hypothetical protein